MLKYVFSSLHSGSVSNKRTAGEPVSVVTSWATTTACCTAYTHALLGTIVPVSSAAYIPVRFNTIFRFTNTKLPFRWGADYIKRVIFPKILEVWY